MLTNSEKRMEAEVGPSLGLLDFFIFVGERKKLVGTLTLAFSLLGLATSYLLPKRYSSTTVILPPQQNSSASSSALAQIGALTGMGASGFGSKSPEEMYVAFLKTASIQNELVKKNQLIKHYGVELQSDARAELSNATRAFADKKTGLVTIEVHDVDRNVAAMIANQYFTELKDMLEKIATTDSQAKRLFLQQQVAEAKSSLMAAEEAFKIEKARSGFVVSQALAEGGIKESFGLRSIIASKEVELSVLQRFATEKNTSVIKLEAELGKLRAKLTELEFGDGSKAGDVAVGMRGVSAYRDFKVREAAYESLVRQLEIAKIDEANEGPLVQQVDIASPAERATSPRKMHLILGGCALGLFVSVSFVLMSAMVRHNKRLSVQLGRLSGAWISGRA